MTREEAKNILTSVLHTDGAFMDYLDSEDVEAIKVLASDEKPHGEWEFVGDNLFKCTHCGYSEMCALYEQKRPHGEWIDTEFLKLKECSYCHVRWGMYDVENFNFCPNCGADMRKGKSK